jgi:methyl-accepting chemotaxis protein
LAEGDVNQTIDIDSRDEVGQLADAFREMITAQKELAAAAATITAGNMNVDVKIRGDKDVLGQSFTQLKQTIGNLVTETNSVVQAAQQGQLDKRGDANKFRGAYQELLQGFNSTLDAVIEPVMESASILEQVAQRDMTKRVQGAYRGDHAKIKNALNQALDNLEEALSQAASGAGQVTSAANEISRGSQSLAQGASEQASSLEEVSSSLEEMSSMTKQNADNSNQGKLLAAEARVSSERGNEAMQRMGDAISKIKSSADATAKILRTIDEIAFQTNLLALNAAVEAARAGEAGKGFAVVAEEVRNLAQRSAEAAKNTANLIEESVTNADGGVRIAEEVAKLLSEIGEGSRKVNDLVGEIAAACNEQSKGIDQINVAVTQLDKVTQQNAASSEESASAAEELNSQAISLSQIVAQFRLNGVKQTATPAAASNTRRTSGATQERSKRTRDNVPDERELVGAGSTRGKNNASRILPLDDDDFSGF